MFYKHGEAKHSAQEHVNGIAHTNGIESVLAALKRGYNGVYRNWSGRHVRRYVDALSFRLNARDVRQGTQDRLGSSFGGMAGKTIAFEGLTA